MRFFTVLTEEETDTLFFLLTVNCFWHDFPKMTIYVH